MPETSRPSVSLCYGLMGGITTDEITELYHQSNLHNSQIIVLTNSKREPIKCELPIEQKLKNALGDRVTISSLDINF